MDILEEIQKAVVLRENYRSLYRQQVNDVKSGTLPIEKSGSESLKCQAEFFLNLYAQSYHIIEMAKYVLNDTDRFLESSIRSKLEGIVKDMGDENDKAEKAIVEKLIG